MCGLWAYFLRSGRLFDTVDYVRHDPWKHASANRGPDSMTEVQGADYHLCFHRLAIHDATEGGNQPFYLEWKNGTIMHLMCNGEIYNYDDLVRKFRLKNKLRSKSDCEVICHLLEHFKGDVRKVVEVLDGEFAFVVRLEDTDGHVIIHAARDAYGVRPLFYGTTNKGIIFSSLLSGIVAMDQVGAESMAEQFPPGFVYTEWLSDTSLGHKWDACEKVNAINIDDKEQAITQAFIHAVSKRLSSERGIGFLLSGGLDSSLVVAVATKILGMSRPKTFSIGMHKDAPDLVAARKVAAYLNTDHTEVLITPEEALEVIPDVIKAIESYDITTVRASTPQYMLAQYIANNTQVRVIMNGDGADEVEGGYLYFKNAPTTEAFHDECQRLVANIHFYDGLRVDRTLGAHGLEARVPFLDAQFVATYMTIDPKFKVIGDGKIEKQMIRDAFYNLYPKILPEEILYRRKDAFSDAVSTVKDSWFIRVKEYSEHAKKMTEQEWYKVVFDTHFPGHRHVIPGYWMPRWIPEASDPSARTLSLYHSTNDRVVDDSMTD